ncbi:hypothetical protein RI367_007065 [Sorochytrium milnesiophthora]
MSVKSAMEALAFAMAVSPLSDARLESNANEGFRTGLTDLKEALQRSDADTTRTALLEPGKDYIKFLFTAVSIIEPVHSKGLAVECLELALDRVTFADVAAQCGPLLHLGLTSDYKPAKDLTFRMMEKWSRDPSNVKALTMTAVPETLARTLSGESAGIAERATTLLIQSKLVNWLLEHREHCLAELLHSSETVLMRAYELVLGCLLTADGAEYGQLKNNSVVHTVLQQVQEPASDILMQVNVLELLRQLCTPRTLDRLVELDLISLAARTASDHSASDSFAYLVRSAAISMLGRLYSCAEQSVQFEVLQQHTQLMQLLTRALNSLAGLATKDEDEENADVSLAAVLAFSQLNTALCLAFLLHSEDATAAMSAFAAACHALLRQTAPGMRGVALAALNHFFGSTSASPASGAAQLSVFKEVYDKLSSHSNDDFVNVLLGLCKHPDEEIRIATYTCLLALAAPVHAAWSLGIPGYCLNQGHVFGLLLDRNTEPLYQGKVSKWDIIKRLTEARLPDGGARGDLALWTDQLTKYVREGVLYTPVAPAVATEKM